MDPVDSNSIDVSESTNYDRYVDSDNYVWYRTRSGDTIGFDIRIPYDSIGGFWKDIHFKNPDDTIKKSLFAQNESITIIPYPHL